MIDPGKVVEIGRLTVLQQVRDRSGLLLMLVLPTLVVAVLGLRLGGPGVPVLGVVAPADDAAAAALVAALEGDELGLRPVDDEAALRSLVEHGRLDAGIVIPDGFSATLRGGGTAEVRFVGTSGPPATAVRVPVEAVVARADALFTAARVAVTSGAATFDEGVAAASSAEAGAPGVTVELALVGEPGPLAGLEPFTIGATSQLVLFMFLTSLIAVVRQVRTRELGVSRRLLAGPTTPRTILVGEASGRLAIALLQGLAVVTITAIAFGVNWGDPLALGAVITLFGIVSAAAAMLLGAVTRNADQAAAVAVFAGLALGALGGCLVPYQVMPPPLQAIARLLPHAWALLGLETLAGDPEAGVGSVSTDLGVLAVYGVGLAVLAAWRARNTLAA
jgi:ABC-2 type transport system permease protein